MLTHDNPVYVHSAAVYKPTKQLTKLCTRLSRYDEKYELFLERDGLLWLPRAACPMGVDLRTDGTTVAFQDNFKPRNPDQQRVVGLARERLGRAESFIIQAPTGWGKTWLGAALVSSVKKRALIITTKQDIIDQWVDALVNCCGVVRERIGIWRGDQVPPADTPVVIGLVQSIMKGPERYPEMDWESFGLVICDEVHRMGADQFSQCMWWLPGRLRVGLSATPTRRDGKDDVFVGHIGPVAIQAKSETAVPDVVMRWSNWKVPMVNWYGRYQKVPHDFGRTMQLMKFFEADEERNDMIARFVSKAVEKDRNILVFSDTLRHLLVLGETIGSAGVSKDDIGYYAGLSNSVYSGTEKQRKVQREKAKLKRVLLATYKMASEATDIPWMDTCVLASPKADVIQIVGRIRREWPDKKKPLVFDIVDADSHVLAAYGNKRLRWYRSLGSTVKLQKP